MLGAEGAAELYRAFLDDVLGAARAVAGVRVELWIPDPDPGPLRSRYPDLPLCRQSGDDLGARLSTAFRATFDDGSDRTLVVGSDHPTLSPSLIRSLLDLLDDAPAALGPTSDGGYWGIGLRASAWPPARRLFEDVPWSTSDVLAVTRRRAREAGLALAEGATWYDVDRPEDLERMCSDAAADSATSRALVRLEERRA